MQRIGSIERSWRVVWLLVNERVTLSAEGSGLEPGGSGEFGPSLGQITLLHPNDVSIWIGSLARLRRGFDCF